MSGSQPYLLMKNINGSLVGRIGILDLYGLSLREFYRLNNQQPFSLEPDYLFDTPHREIPDIWFHIWSGSLPEVYHPAINKNEYFSSYLRSYFSRDVQDVLSVTDVSQYITFITALAGRIGSPLNLNSIARDVQISVPTAKRWLAALQATNQIYLLRPYLNNLTKRSIKSPKIYFTDTGLVYSLLKYQTAEQQVSAPSTDPFLRISSLWKSLNLLKIMKS